MDSSGAHHMRSYGLLSGAMSERVIISDWSRALAGTDLPEHWSWARKMAEIKQAVRKDEEKVVDAKGVEPIRVNSDAEKGRGDDTCSNVVRERIMLSTMRDVHIEQVRINVSHNSDDVEQKIDGAVDWKVYVMGQPQVKRVKLTAKMHDEGDGYGSDQDYMLCGLEQYGFGQPLSSRKVTSQSGL